MIFHTVCLFEEHWKGVIHARKHRTRAERRDKIDEVTWNPKEFSTKFILNSACGIGCSFYPRYARGERTLYRCIMLMSNNIKIVPRFKIKEHLERAHSKGSGVLTMHLRRFPIHPCKEKQQF